MERYVKKINNHSGITLRQRDVGWCWAGCDVPTLPLQRTFYHAWSQLYQIFTGHTEFSGYHYVQVSRLSVKNWGNGSICPRIFWTPLVYALWSPAGKRLTSWLSFVVYYCEFVTFPLVSWFRCGTWLYRFPDLCTLSYFEKYIAVWYCWEPKYSPLMLYICMK